MSQTYLFTREKRKGWISCGYGPFRRLYGLSSQSANITDPLEERFITLFDEGGTLYKYETWLKDLQLLALKNGLIDEIDTHLHPKWQREIGFWLTKTFPNIQFIVTTHSPFVAMAAAQGALTVLEKCGDAVIAKQKHPFMGLQEFACHFPKQLTTTTTHP